LGILSRHLTAVPERVYQLNTAGVNAAKGSGKHSATDLPMATSNSHRGNATALALLGAAANL
jgi:hypothetical protein